MKQIAVYVIAATFGYFLAGIGGLLSIVIAMWLSRDILANSPANSKLRIFVTKVTDAGWQLVALVAVAFVAVGILNVSQCSPAQVDNYQEYRSY